MEPHDTHLTVELLSRYCRGDISWREYVDFVAGHLAHRCPLCAEELAAFKNGVHAQIPSWYNQLAWKCLEARLEAELPHEKKRRQQAVREVAALRRLPSWEERTHRVENSWRWYQSEATALALLRESQACLPADPVSAEHWAHLAREVASRASNVDKDRSFRAAWLLSHAHAGNALRAAGRLREAEATFEECQRFSRHQLHGEPYALAEMYRLRASLLRDRGKYMHAAESLSDALRLYQHQQERQLEGRCWVKLSSIHHEAGDLNEAEQAARRGIALLKTEGPTWARLTSVHALAFILSMSARGVTEAARLYSTHRRLYQKFPASENHRIWLCGMIATRRGAYHEAELHLRRARTGLTEERNAYDAARVGLDLALLYANRGYSREVAVLAASMVAEFRQQEAANREAVAALLLFQEAVHAEALTEEFAKALGRYLQLVSRQPTAGFKFEFQIGRAES